MPDPKTYPLKFDCYKCGKESIYPKYLQGDKENDGVKSVIKRCTTCGTENKVELPDGWIALRNDVVLRGMKED